MAAASGEIEGTTTQPLLIKSKLNPPLSGLTLVPRMRLKKWVEDSARAKLVLLRAPAGFGKTTVMVGWERTLRDEGVVTSWLTLDEADNDVGRFLNYLVGAFQKIDADLAPVIINKDIPVGENVPAEQWVNLIDRLASVEVPFVLFLDEAEVVRNNQINEIIKQLIRHLPSGSRIIVASRTAPELGLGKLRAQGLFMELGPKELEFLPEETERFICGTRGLDLDGEDLARLHDRTNGWIAGLQLAAIALASRRDTKSFILSFSGSSADIADYLAEDVLSRLPQEVGTFLMQTSILNVLSAPLCNALTNRTGGQEMLQYLEKESLFVTPLDSDRRWYRYHDFFAQFLRARLERGLESKVMNLHRTAAEWFFKEGRFVDSARHSLLCADAHRAAESLDECAKELVRLGQVATIAELVEQLPKDALINHPRLQLGYAWSLTYGHRFDEASAILDQIIQREEAPALDPLIADEISALRPLILLFADRFDKCESVAQESLKKISDKFSYNWISTANIYSYCLLTAGRFEEAHQMILRANQANTKTGSYFAGAYTDCVEAMLLLAQGRVNGAISHSRTSLQRVREAQPGYSLPGALNAVALAVALYERNELEEAYELLSRHMFFIRQWGAVALYLIGYITMARIHYVNGDYEKALQTLDKAEKEGLGWNIPRIAATLRMEKARMMLQTGDANGALLVAQKSSEGEIWQAYGDRHLPTNYLQPIIVNRLRLMVRTGNSQKAIPVLDAELARLEGSNSELRRLKLLILKAETLDACGDLKGALLVLRGVVVAACHERFIRAFADEGKPILRLLRALKQSVETDRAEPGDFPMEYLDTLLGAMSDSRKQPVERKSKKRTGDIDALSAREISVLELVAIGLSNRNIAESLFISETTVRFHLRNVNLKLNAKNRTEAVSKARELSIIS